MTDKTGVIKSYAEALFLLTEEEGRTEAVRRDSEDLSKILADNPSYTRLLDSPALSREERTALAHEAFSRLDGCLVNLIKILTEKRLAGMLPSVLAEYRRIYDRSRGIERVDALTAVKMTSEQIEKLKLKLEKITGKQIIINNIHVPELIGGIKLRYLGIELDATVRERIDSLARSLDGLVI